MSFFGKRLCKFLLIGGLTFSVGGCSFSSQELPKIITENVYIYHFNKKVVTITGPFVKREKNYPNNKYNNYTSFTEITEEDKKLKPILYQIDINKTVYLDCQKDGFNGNESPLNFLVERGDIKKHESYTTYQICKSIGY